MDGWMEGWMDGWMDGEALTIIMFAPPILIALS